MAEVESTPEPGVEQARCPEGARRCTEAKGGAGEVASMKFRVAPKGLGGGRGGAHAQARGGEGEVP